MGRGSGIREVAWIDIPGGGQVDQHILKAGADTCPVRRIPAAEIEAAVVDQLRAMLRTPEIVVATWRAARSEIKGLSEAQVRDALRDLDPMWDELFPAEQARIVQLLVERVDVGVEGVDIRLRTAGLVSLVGELRAKTSRDRIAA